MTRLEEDRAALLDRLYARLTNALCERTDPWGAPVTVAELYQELIPYRTVRSDVGFAMNADYEHTLLRLLSGEADLAKLEPPSAREEISRELRSSNPNVSIYREYAACEVWITPPDGTAHADETEAWLESLRFDEELDAAGLLDTVLQLTEEDEIEQSTQEPSAREAMRTRVSPEAGADRPGRGAAVPAPTAAEQRASSAADEAVRYAPAEQAAVASITSGGSCVFCDSKLPAGRTVRYCPFCGGDQTMRPCGRCGEALDPGWVFCIACGAPSGEG
jgi:hypothetical protein